MGQHRPLVAQVVTRRGCLQPRRRVGNPRATLAWCNSLVLHGGVLQEWLQRWRSCVSVVASCILFFCMLPRPCGRVRRIPCRTLKSAWWVGLASSNLCAPTVPRCMQAPPAHPWPQVAAVIGNLEANRERNENANVDQLQRDFNEALAAARQNIGDTIGRTLRPLGGTSLESGVLHGRWGRILGGCCGGSCAVSPAPPVLSGPLPELAQCSGNSRKSRWVHPCCLSR